jgi:hypothetical protein
VQHPLPGMDEWIRQAIKYADGCLWNNGSWVIRNMKTKGKEHLISNHARGLATDLSYRWQVKQGRGKHDGEKLALVFLNKVLQNAETLGVQLVIDYNRNRSYKIDRCTWKAGNFSMGDWLHVECDYELIKDPVAVKSAWFKVFGGIPQTV